VGNKRNHIILHVGLLQLVTASLILHSVLDTGNGASRVPPLYLGNGRGGQTRCNLGPSGGVASIVGACWYANSDDP